MITRAKAASQYLVIALAVIGASATSGRASDVFKPPKRILLWPAGAPDAKGTEEADTSVLFVYLPEANNRATDTGVVICPGGGYAGHAMDHEGAQIARFFNDLGVAAFVLRYRLAPYRHPVPLADAQRALRLVRAKSAQFRIRPDRIGVMGFSAGGHLASTLATHFDRGNSEADDPIDRQSCRPDFAILCYPVISMTDTFTHAGSKRNLLGSEPDPALARSLSNETQVTAETPPTFLFHTDADRAVPAENSVAFYLALRKAGVPAELHVYQTGRHGVGLSPNDPILATWSGRLRDWLVTNRCLPPRDGIDLPPGNE